MLILSITELSKFGSFVAGSSKMTVLAEFHQFHEIQFRNLLTTMSASIKKFSQIFSSEKSCSYTYLHNTYLSKKRGQENRLLCIGQLHVVCASLLPSVFSSTT